MASGAHVSGFRARSTFLASVWGTGGRLGKGGRSGASGFVDPAYPPLPLDHILISNVEVTLGWGWRSIDPIGGRPRSGGGAVAMTRGRRALKAMAPETCRCSSLSRSNRAELPRCSPSMETDKGESLDGSRENLRAVDAELGPVGLCRTERRSRFAGVESPRASRVRTSGTKIRPIPPP